MKIITCDLPLPIQRLYIKRLKHMIEKWEHNKFCGHCPAAKGFSFSVFNAMIDKFIYWPPCSFCRVNMGISKSIGCPCYVIGSVEALKRAKDFIRRLEHENPI